MHRSKDSAQGTALGHYSLIGLLPLALTIAPVQDEGIDLTVKYESGKTYTIEQNTTMTMDLDDVSATMNGEEMIEGGLEFGMELDMTGTISEEVLEVREGEIAKMNVTIDDMSVAVTGDVVTPMGTETIDESPEMPAVGRTIEVTIDEDGEVTKKDITEGVDTPLSDEEAAMAPHRNYLDLLLPSEAAEVGVAFELAPDWESLVQDMMASMDTAGMGGEEAEMAEMMMNAFVDATTIEATGTVTKVEEGIATIEYEMNVQTAINDLMDLVKQAVPDAAEMPPINAMLEMSMDATGVAMFNVEEHMFQSFEFSGDFEIAVSADGDIQGPMEASAVLSGEFSSSNSITIE